MTRLERALDALKDHGTSMVLVNRLSELSRQFGSEESFVSATKGTLLKAWAETHPAGQRGLSERTFRAHADLAALWRSADNPAEPLPEPVLQRKLTLEGLGKVKDFMEMFSLQEITISRIFDLLEMTKGGQQ